MNTIENNKLLAEFMGGYQYDQEDDFITFDFTNNIFSNDTISLKHLKFDIDWNWLMEVVEKIDSLCINTGFEIYSRYVHIRVNNNLTISSNVCNSKREAVYKACVEFVKWYNEQNN